MLTLVLAVFIASLLGTGLIRRYAAARLMDIPNARSSHSLPTPRGGGLAIVLALAGASYSLFAGGRIPFNAWAAFNCALPVALIGFLDDHRHVPARWRLSIHILAAAGATYFLLYDLPVYDSPPAILTGLGPAARLTLTGAALLALVWSLNLFNFMDGIDGLAGSQALFVAGGLGLFLAQEQSALSGFGYCAAAAAAGFLCWNWPKAKIFMGDVGSGYLGLILGIYILAAACLQAKLLYCGTILHALFICDASYTLLTRMLTGQAWLQAHRLHAYQRIAARRGHAAALQAAWAINLGWLTPLAFWAYWRPDYAWAGMLLSYLPLLLLVNRLKAGQPD